jgi:DNA-binding transcriptional regulator YdaS (Cro superfamily)
MKKVLFTAALLAAMLGGFTAVGLRSQELTEQEVRPAAGVFDKFLKPDGPECVPVSEIRSVSRLTKLSPAQFQFVRALYIAIPPVSQQLPPGDSAVVANADGKTMIALVTQGRVACARFLAPDYIMTMLAQVGKGETGSSGEPI